MEFSKKLSVILLIIVITQAATLGWVYSNTQVFNAKSSLEVSVNVEFTLFKAGQAAPDQYLVNGGWRVLAITPTGITYQVEVHNVETNCFANYFQYQVAGGASIKQTTPNLYIALTTNSTAVSADGSECVLNGELTGNGEDRAQATITLNNTAISSKQSQFKAAKTFSITGGTNTLNKAGLGWQSTSLCAANTGSSTAKSNGCFIAITAVPSPPTVINLDSFTANWTVTFTGT